jgi:spore coat polysaccharide biosynthesis protein SpsF
MVLSIIQARMGSARLPGKVLMRVGGEPLLLLQLNRVSKAKKIDKIVVATSTQEKDDVIEELCHEHSIDCFRGSEDDVMRRYYDCAVQYNPKAIVRLTADCPLVDPVIIDRVIEKFTQDKVDYCANNVPPETRTFPDGFDVEVFSMQALSYANKYTTNKNFREHVTFQFWQEDAYTSTQYMNDIDCSEYRLTVDYPEDFEVIEYVFNKLKEKKYFGNMDEIIKIVNNGDMKRKNQKYYFGQGW